jgi:hypothetical protein
MTIHSLQTEIYFQFAQFAIYLNKYGGWIGIWPIDDISNLRNNSAIYKRINHGKLKRVNQNMLTIAPLVKCCSIYIICEHGISISI